MQTMPVTEAKGHTKMTEKTPQINLNSILLAITLSVMLFIGKATVENGNKLSSIESVATERAILTTRLNEKVDSLTNEISLQKVAIAAVQAQLALIPSLHRIP